MERWDGAWETEKSENAFQNEKLVLPGTGVVVFRSRSIYWVIFRVAVMGWKHWPLFLGC
jgi:hypothetical protein